MPAPRFLGYPALLGEPKPINWNGIGQALWGTNINAPIRGFYNLMNTPYDVLMGGDSLEKQQAVADSFDAAGGITVGSMPMPKPANSLSMGIKAYHGSPHSFDKFSMDKIGTGEGAQAYGHGLYFAENEGVAKGYRDTLSNRDGSGYATAHLNAQNLVNKVGGDAEYAAQVLRDQLDQTGDEFTAQKIRDTLDFITSGKYAEPLPPAGHVYEVEINADPNAFLDWDKPLSEQPPQMTELVRQALKDKGYLRANDNGPRQLTSALKAWRMAEGGMAETSMEALLGGRGGMLGKTPEEASAKLREAGIPGIKYLDAGSRGAGDGTRNYVVFDDKLISIVRKYGIAGASAMLGYNLLEGVDKAQAAELQKADTHHQYTNWLSSGGI